MQKGELDLLSGGAPCQSFSYAGKRLGLEDVRGTMFYHYATFLHKLQPKMFLFENVRGLLTHDKGRTYKTITDIFESTGYTIQKKVLNAWDYGVDPRWSPAISCIESSKGEACFLPCNAWGWGSESWGSWEEAIYDHVQGLARGYGYTVTPEAAEVYCPPNHERWYEVTVAEMAKI